MCAALGGDHIKDPQPVQVITLYAEFIFVPPRNSTDFCVPDLMGAPLLIDSLYERIC